VKRYKNDANLLGLLGGFYFSLPVVLRLFDDVKMGTFLRLSKCFMKKDEKKCKIPILCHLYDISICNRQYVVCLSGGEKEKKGINRRLGKG